MFSSYKLSLLRQHIISTCYICINFMLSIYVVMLSLFLTLCCHTIDINSFHVSHLHPFHDLSLCHNCDFNLEDILLSQNEWNCNIPLLHPGITCTFAYCCMRLLGEELKCQGPTQRERNMKVRRNSNKSYHKDKGKFREKGQVLINWRSIYDRYKSSVRKKENDKISLHKR